MKYGICNAKAKVEGGGGATLNLAYGLTPPEDTTKIWVKCNEPTAVKVEANRQLVVSSNENAKVVTTETILSTFAVSSKITGNYPYAPNMIKFKDGTKYFICGGANSNSSYVNGVASQGLIKMDADGTTTKIPYYSSQVGDSSTIGWWIEKIDEESFIGIYSQSSNLRWTKYKKDGTIINYQNKTFSYGTSINYLDVANQKYYVFTQGLVWVIDLTNSSLASQNYTCTLTTSISNRCNAVKYNGYLYTIKGVDLYKINMNDFSYEVVKENLPIKNGTYAPKNFMLLLYGNKLIVADTFYSTSYFGDFLCFIDLDTLNVDKLTLDFPYYCSFICIDGNTGNIELWGNYPSNNRDKRKVVISNIYTLTENTLDLFYDNYYNKNIRLVNEDTLTIDAPIDHAWLGDSNNIAQPVELRYYEDDLWWGVNCLGWTQLSSAVITASNVSIDLNSATTDTQTITITLTWGNQTGETTTSVVSSDDTIATASLSGDSLTITGVAVGSATITISVVDEYGTTFTKTITATITNSGA